MSDQVDAAAPARGLLEIVFIGLAVQCGMGFLSALGELAFAAILGSPALLLWTLLAGVGVPAALAVCAFRLQHGGRWSRRIVLVVEVALAIATVLRWLFGVLPASALLALTSGAILPLLIAGLLVLPSVRACFGGRVAAAAPAQSSTPLPAPAGRR